MRKQKQDTIDDDYKKSCTFTPKLNNYKLKQTRSLIEKSDQWTSIRENRNNIHNTKESTQCISRTWRKRMNCVLLIQN